VNSWPPASSGFLTAEAIHQAALDAHVVLPHAAKAGVEVFNLDGPERQMMGDLDVCAAANVIAKELIDADGKPVALAVNLSPPNNTWA